MSWRLDIAAAWDLLHAIAPKLVQRLRMTDPRDTAWEQYTMTTEIEGKPYDATIRVELKNKRGGGEREDAPTPRKREKAK